ncbi:hypothetical protein [Nitrosospira sp. NRS527]|uniref:hypothetical protein n=1 Tax=Nitrosospira sp. NRS527 TaxID=155925 RepID=UPI001AF0D7EA|nr:hypothetical protein [Nitrosospira sp. NRS527]BCT67386.1 hypothetical protein NNRS527_00968 [Nitrosospira sp. NRS527]
MDLDDNFAHELKQSLAQILAEPETRDYLQREVFLPLIRLARNPKSDLNKFLKLASQWVNENESALTLHIDELKKADARAEELLKQMDAISLKEFLSLEPIDPYTLLLIAHKLDNRANADAKYGQKMRTGRKPGSVGKLTKLVAKHLQKNPAATAGQMWDTFKKKKPKEMEFMDTSSGRYIEYFDKKGMKGQSDTSYRRFQNIVSEQRGILKSTRRVTE